MQRLLDVSRLYIFGADVAALSLDISLSWRNDLCILRKQLVLHQPCRRGTIGNSLIHRTVIFARNAWVQLYKGRIQHLYWILQRHILILIFKSRKKTYQADN